MWLCECSWASSPCVTEMRACEPAGKTAAMKLLPLLADVAALVEPGRRPQAKCLWQLRSPRFWLRHRSRIDVTPKPDTPLSEMFQTPGEVFRLHPPRRWYQSP